MKRKLLLIIGAAFLTVSTFVQACASVMVTVYIPLVSMLISSVAAPLFQLKLKGAYPPETSKSIRPSAAPGAPLQRCRGYDAR